MSSISEGEAFVGPRSPEKARELLDLAEKAGLDASVVRTTMGGYIVPADLVPSGDEQKEKKPTRRRTKETDQ